MRQKPFRLFSRAALALLMMLLTTATAWADDINVETAAGFGTLTDGKYTLVNGNTYTLTEDVNTAGYIYVPKGVTATIDLNGHTIDRGLTSAVENGYVIYVKGALTLTDSSTGGTVKGGMDNSSDHVSCVKVISDNGGAAFTLEGGTLIGNRSSEYNKAVSGGNNTSITISGGKITGDAWGIFSYGNITVSGGEISGNTIGIQSLNYSISVSGNPVITNNTSANVQLYSYGASVLTIAGELTDGANIGITKGGARPTDNAPVTITSGYGTYNNNVSPSTYFSLDNNGQIQTSPVDYMTVVMGWNEDRTEIAVGTALYTVNFDMNGHGDAVDAVSLLSGYKVAEPTEPTADGWYFFGWYTDDACTSQWNFDNAVTSNMTLHALWAQEAIYSFTLPEKMVIVSTTNAPVGGKYPVGTVIKFKVSSADYVVDGDVSDGTNTLTPDGDGNYTITMGDADITITASVKKAVEPNKTLSGSESYTANDGDVLTGSTSGTVTIADGAKITLSDVTITGGIVCAGTAEITLVGTNSVSGATNKAGIQVGGSGTTLTIKGNGSLTANGGDQSAGIGLSRAWKPANNVIGGDIIIEGGNITANGSVNGQWGAGIGTGVIYYGDGSAKTARIGNITIKGGSVKATGGSEANGIGTGFTYNGCINTIGTVTIYDGIDKVDASSIKDSGSIVYKHEENDVTASTSDYFTIIENGNRRIIVQKVTPTIADVPDQTYTGSAITPEPLVQTGSLNLTKGTDYEYSYTNNTNVGTAKVTVTFKGDYASLGSVEKEFTIAKATPAVTAPTAFENLIYNGSAQALVNAGSTDFGTLLYSLDGTNYSDAIPTATDAGTYTIYYKVEGSSNWGAVDAATVEAAIVNYVASLADNADNTNDINNIITNYDSKADVTLSGRTLYKDGYWNTLVLPFDVTIASSPLAGDNVVAKVLNESSNLVGGTLTLNFDNAPATIPAGTPFIIKWNNTGVNLVNPVFTGVTIDNTNRDVNFTGGSFMGTYAPLEITEANRSKVLLLSGGNKLGYAKTDRTIANGKALGTCRAYFYFPGSQTARSFVMNFGDDDTTSLREKGIVKSEEFATAAEWYTLDGVKLSGKPTKKGLYIHGGKKVVVH